VKITSHKKLCPQFEKRLGGIIIKIGIIRLVDTTSSYSDPKETSWGQFSSYRDLNTEALRQLGQINEQ